MAHRDRPEELEETKEKALDEGDIQLLKTYGQGPYTKAIKELEKAVEVQQKKVNELIGVVNSDTGLSLPSQWDLVSDEQMLREEQVGIRLSIMHVQNVKVYYVNNQNTITMLFWTFSTHSALIYIMLSLQIITVWCMPVMCVWVDYECVFALFSLLK